MKIFLYLGWDPGSYFIASIQGCQWNYSRCLAMAPLSKWIFCWLFTFPTPTILICTSFQWEYPPQWWLGCRSISVVINPRAATTTGTTFVFTPHILSFTQPSSRIALSLIWHPLFYLSVIIKSGCRYPNLSWSVRTLKSLSFRSNPRFPDWS